MNNVSFLPVWKKGETAEEWFMEMSIFAKKWPEKFKKVALIYQEDVGGNKSRDDYYCFGVTTTELLGLIESAKFSVMEKTRGQ